MENMKLRTARKKRYWTIAKVCELAQVSDKAYRSWEKGTHTPHLSSLEILCNAFGMEAHELGFEQSIETQEIQEPSRGIVRITPQEAEILAPLLRGDITMTHLDEAKRRSLEKLAGILKTAAIAPLALANPEPWEQLTQAAAKPAKVDTHTLTHFEQLLETCRGMSNGTELELAEQLLSKFLPRLQQIAPFQPEAASLASQSLQLSSILVAHRLKITEKVAICQQSVEHAKYANSTSILVASLLELAVAFQYNQQPIQALQTYQEALLSLKNTSPVLQARTYVETGAAFARIGRKQEALFYLGLAYDTLPDHPEQDTEFALSDYCGPYTLALYNGQIHLDLSEPTNAWNGFEKFKVHASGITVPERIRLEIVNHQGRAAILENDLDKYTFCLDEGLSGAVALKSKKRFDEAYSILQQIPSSWHKETKIQNIAQQYKIPIN